MRDTPLRGYKKKPLPITVITAVFLLLPCLELVWMAVLAGGSLSVVWPVLRSSYFLQEWWLSWSAAAAVSLVSRAGFVYFLCLSGVVLCTRVTRLIAHPELEAPIDLLVTGAWLAIVVYVVASSLHAPYLNPRLRWWLRPRRVALRHSAWLLLRRQRIPVTVLNLSMGGAFIRIAAPLARHGQLPQHLGQRVGLRLLSKPSPHAKPLRITTRAELVWKGREDSPYRHGVGLRFFGLPRQTRWALRHYLRHHGHNT